MEIGGTVGDYEGLSFIEAIREFSQKVGRANCLFVHVVFVPYLEVSGEYKTKPAQNALADLRGFGIMPDVVAVRTEGKRPAGASVANKISMFSGVPLEGIVMMPNVDTVYKIPLTIARDLGATLTKFSGITTEPDLSQWEQLVHSDRAEHKKTVTIGLVAKYVDNSDTYLSVTEALKSAAWSQKSDVAIKWINAEMATDEDFASVDGLVVPGGFGSRGVEGKIAAARYALEHNVPYLGLCLGLQVAVIAAARRSGLEDANSTEFAIETPHDVVYIMPGQEGMESTGGTMRLGDYPATLVEGSLVASLYNIDHVIERHRHRYEVNQRFISNIKKGGLTISGTSPDGSLVEFIEAPKNNFFVATQAHPEFRSRPTRAHPLFVGLVKASIM